MSRCPRGVVGLLVQIKKYSIFDGRMSRWRGIPAKLQRKSINGLYRFERLVIFDLLRVDKNDTENDL